MARARRIGILTGGGDVPGLNAVIKSVVYRATELGYDVLGIRRGWMGLTHMRQGLEFDPDFIRPLNRANTQGIDRTGGTMLHSSRTNPPKMRRASLPAHLSAEKAVSLAVADGVYNLTPVVLDNVEHLGLDYLVTIGGDDTLSFAQVLHTKGIRVIGVPKTMDNDVQGTEYCIGFSTAITRAKELITRQRTTLGSHERIGIFRIFGRDSGFTALHTAYVTAGRCVIPEVPFHLEGLIEILLQDKRNNPSRYAFVIASEGAVWQGRSVAEYGEADAYGHKKKVDIGHALGEEIAKRTGEETMVSDLTYDLRSGDPDSLDQIVAITLANVAVDLIQEGIHGRLTAVQGGKYTHAPLPDPKLTSRRIDVPKMYNIARYRPQYAGRLGSPLLLVPVEFRDFLSKTGDSCSGLVLRRRVRENGIGTGINMADEEQEQKLFTLSEAERTRRELEPVLIEAIEARRKLAPLDEELSGIATRIQMTGGMVVAYEHAAQLRSEHDQLAESLQSAVETIQATGCVLKDLDVGLLDFPAVIDNEEVYLCWRLGEERIRFWHRQDEGFSGRRPLVPGDLGPQNPIQ